MLLTDTRVDFDTTAAVRAPAGFFFGKGRALHADRLLVEVDGHLDPGDRVEVRLTLSPSDVTVHLDVRVVRQMVTAPGEMARWSLSVESLSTSDRALFDAWLVNQKAGGTYSRFDLVSRHDAIGATMQGASNTEVRAALARMAARDGSEPAPRSVMSGLAAGGPGRDAMRDALRRAALGPPPSTPATSPMASPTQGHAAPGLPPRPPSLGQGAAAGLPPRAGAAAGMGAASGLPPRPPVTTSAAVAGLPPRPTTGVPSAPPIVPSAAAPQREPSVAVFSAGTTTWVELRWTTYAAFLPAAQCLLAATELRVPTQPGVSLPTAGSIRVVARHLQCVVEGIAHAAGQSTSSVSYVVVLPSPALATLRSHLASTVYDG